MAILEPDQPEWSDPNKRDELKAGDKLKRLRRKITADNKLKETEGVPTTIDLEQAFMLCVRCGRSCNCEPRGNKENRQGGG